MTGQNPNQHIISASSADQQRCQIDALADVWGVATRAQVEAALEGAHGVLEAVIKGVRDTAGVLGLTAFKGIDTFDTEPK